MKTALKQLIALILTSCLLLTGLTACQDTQPVDNVPATSSPSPTAAPVNDVVVLFTNDVHCGVDDAIGYAGLAAYKAQLQAEGKSVVLVDAGDSIQGAPLGTLSQGEYIVDIMEKVGYDLAVPGNHEFDYGMERFLALAKEAEYDYISANFMDLQTGKNVLEPYKILEVGGRKIAFIGVCTPETISSSTPTYFQNEQGEYIYSFCGDENGQAFYTAIQNAVDAAKAEGADYVVAVAHLGIEAKSSPWMSTELIANTNGIDAVLDGHSHSVIAQDKVKNKEGKEVLLSSTGTKLNAIGYFSIDKEGNLQTGFIEEYTEKDAEVDGYIKGIQAQYATLLTTVVAQSNVNLVVNDPETEVRIVRCAETNLGNFCADAYRAMTGADVAMANGGGVRAEIGIGDVTYEDILTVHPFGNELCMIETTGAKILDMLEMGSMDIPNESGSFQHVSGLTYEIDLNVESSVSVDENGVFHGVQGTYRVKNVMIGGKPLELDKTYTLASHNYLLKNGGDGFIFRGDKMVLEDIMLDNQALITYITENLGGVIGQEYADPYGEGRITVIPKS